MTVADFSSRIMDEWFDGTDVAATKDAQREHSAELPDQETSFILQRLEAKRSPATRCVRRIELPLTAVSASAAEEREGKRLRALLNTWSRALAAAHTQLAFDLPAIQEHTSSLFEWLHAVQSVTPESGHIVLTRPSPESRRRALELLERFLTEPDEKGEQYWNEFERDVLGNRLKFRDLDP